MAKTERCFLKTELNGEVEVEFMGVFQLSKVMPPSISVGGSPGGVVANPIVIVKHNGKLLQCNLKDVRFQTDEEVTTAVEFTDLLSYAARKFPDITGAVKAMWREGYSVDQIKNFIDGYRKLKELK